MVQNIISSLFKRRCYWLCWTAFNTCLAVLVCKAENMNVVKCITPLVLTCHWIDQTIWFLVGWRASSIDPLPRVDALAEPFKQRGDKNNRVQVKYQQIIQSIDMRCVIFDSFTFLLLYYSTYGYMRGERGAEKRGWPMALVTQAMEELCGCQDQDGRHSSFLL